MNPKKFLVLGGIVLVVVGLLGFVGVIGPTEESSVFGSGWWFDNGENWAHLILGVLALVVLKTFPVSTHKPIVVIVGVLGILFAVYNLFSTNFLGTNLESPMDLILHLVVGIWALSAARGQSGAPSTQSPQTSQVV